MLEQIPTTTERACDAAIGAVAPGEGALPNGNPMLNLRFN